MGTTVLIVGSGPAGLVLAARLARFPGLDVRIVERRSGHQPAPGQRAEPGLGFAARSARWAEAMLELHEALVLPIQSRITPVRSVLSASRELPVFTRSSRVAVRGNKQGTSTCG